MSNEMVAEELKTNFGNKVRVRTMGLLIRDQKMLMINHTGLNESDVFWCPPGGGVNFGETLVESLKREFIEEVNITIDVGRLVCGNEFIEKPFHAMEFFFEVKQVSGNLKLGFDPEVKHLDTLSALQFMTIEELKSLPKGQTHDMFYDVNSFEALMRKESSFFLKNNT